MTNTIAGIAQTFVLIFSVAAAAGAAYIVLGCIRLIEKLEVGALDVVTEFTPWVLEQFRQDEDLRLATFAIFSEISNRLGIEAVRGHRPDDRPHRSSVLEQFRQDEELRLATFVSLRELNNRLVIEEVRGRQWRAPPIQAESTKKNMNVIWTRPTDGYSSMSIASLIGKAKKTLPEVVAPSPIAEDH